MLYGRSSDAGLNPDGVTLSVLGDRRASFADKGFDDVFPWHHSDGSLTGSIPGVTFQVRPKPKDAKIDRLNTPFSDGLPVAMFDGSVRTIAPHVSEFNFWAAVTSRGGEVYNLD
jgi:hypothetical protein